MERIINDTEISPEEYSYNCNEELKNELDKEEENYIMMMGSQETSAEVIE